MSRARGAGANALWIGCGCCWCHLSYLRRWRGSRRGRARRERSDAARRPLRPPAGPEAEQSPG